jgi:hypothetical protein
MGELVQAAENLRSAYDLREQVSQHEELFILSHYHQFVTGNLNEARKTYELRAQIYAHDDIPIGNELAPALPGEFGSYAMERVACLTCYSTYFRGEAYLAERETRQL